MAISYDRYTLKPYAPLFFSIYFCACNAMMFLQSWLQSSAHISFHCAIHMPHGKLICFNLVLGLCSMKNTIGRYMEHSIEDTSTTTLDQDTEVHHFSVCDLGGSIIAFGYMLLDFSLSLSQVYFSLSQLNNWANASW